MRKKLIILSHDALVYDDLAYLREEPTFRYLMENGSRVNTLRSIYPTITYPAHVSIITGQYPAAHGVVNNEVTDFGVLSSPWNWFAEANRGETLFHAAKKAGLTTAAVFWPVTGNDPDIDYLIDEYWTQSSDDTIEKMFARSGSSPEVIEKVVRKHRAKLEGNERRHPQSDEFIISAACEMITEFKPDLLAIHPAAVDGARHRSGLFSEEVNASLDDTERWTMQLIEATKKAGVFEETNFAIISDHGQLEIKRSINLNVLFKEKGYIRTDDNGGFIDYDAYCKSAGMSVQVYLKNPSNMALHDEIYELLCGLRDDGVYGISEVFTRSEANEKEHLYGGFSFVLETDGYTSFGNDWNRPLVRSFDLSDYRFGHATHGYLPDKGPQPTAIFCGPDFKKGVEISRRNIVDLAPTFARLLGTGLPKADGKVIDEVLK
jgi:predicted AlkP superfamily pyrophosphatase or phosphodiesterase